MKDSNQRFRASPGFEPPAHAPNAALLIDFDNVTMGIRSDLQNQLKRLLQSEIFKGKVSVQRAYADWRRYPQYIVPLSESSIDLIFAPAFGSNKKNATDIRLAIDALELVFTRPEIGTFILLSGDSDFSSLVLKLKEYAKYVIGIGIRESSSDLLIQNCDEYYSYNELTGFSKEGTEDRPRHDPWVLVIEALTQMRQNRDVMRSDRLKQVMQEIDPNFDEKDVGFSRFSKFVQEASQRGYLRLTKLDNGQFEVDIGSNANVPPGTELPPVTAQPAESRGEGDSGRRRRGREGDRAAQTREAKGTTLAQAFELLRQILLDLGAIGDESTDAGQVRERMVEKLGESDPIVGEHRFQRLLRQAHDASLIELVKQGEDAYLLKLTPGGTVTAELAVPVAEAAESAEVKAEPAGEFETQPTFDPEQPDRPHRGERTDRGERGDRARGGRGGRGRERGGRGRGRRGEGERPRGEGDRSREPSATTGEHQAASPPEAGSASSGEPARRNVRFRSGSRRPGPSGPGEEGENKQAAAPPAPPAEQPPAPPAPTDGGRRSLRGRQGRSTMKPQRPAASETPAPTSPAPEAPRRSEPPRRSEAPPPPPPPPRAEPRVARSTPATENEPRSLFKRLSGALQKALGTPEKEADE